MGGDQEFVLAREAQVYSGAYQTFSAPLSLPAHRQTIPELPATTLPLFGAARAGVDREHEVIVADTSTSARRYEHSAAAFCGGSIWSLDWCPHQANNDALYLAVAAHPKARDRNVIGHVIEGPVLLQIWRVASLDVAEVDSAAAAPVGAHPGPGGQHEEGVCQSQGDGAGERVVESDSGVARLEGTTSSASELPSMVLGICLTGGVVWDCKWRPGSGAHDRLGTLAAVLGSGEVQLLSVPHPDHLDSAAEAADSEGAPTPVSRGLPGGPSAPRFVRLRPQATAAASTVSGSLPSVVEWLPSAPHDLLLAGYWDGSVAMWRLATGGDAAAQKGPEQAVCLELLLHMPALDGPVRGLAWAPREVATAAGDLAHRNLFVTVGHSSKLRFWDARNAFSPMLEAPVSNRWKMGVEWVADPLGIIVAEDNGVVRWVDLNPFDRTARMSHNSNITGGQQTMWDVHWQPGGGRIAYAGADGEVAVVRLERDLPNQPNIAIAGFRLEGGGVLSVLDRADLAGRARLNAGAKAQPRMSVAQEAIHTVRWSSAAPQPHATHAEGGHPGLPSVIGRKGRGLGKEWPPAWLACGGAAGVLLILRC
ncbi:probable general transcription factor 3C polypeptide 2 [Coccomyxa sp. Obi]|nr:probable general transcription factor 3C polypeptide 2 [Coccomyxa sp. Obi]